MDTPETARAYYDAIDAGDYDRLRDLLAHGFVHERPDRTIEGHDRFVDFMQHDRPMTDTEHQVDRVFSGPAGHVAVEGRLLDENDRLLFEFVDAFQISEQKIERLRTFVA